MRAGLSAESQAKIVEAYKKLYRKGPLLENAKAMSQEDGLDENVKAMLDAIFKSSEHRFGRYLETFRHKLEMFGFRDFAGCIVKRTMDKVRTAVIGAGKMGELHARVYSELPAKPACRHCR